MMKKSNVFIYILTLISLGFVGCNKLLEDKPEKNLKVPTELNDFLALLNHTGVVNNLTLGLGEVSSDNVVFEESTINTYSEYDKNIYSWQSPIMPVEATVSEPWLKPYMAIYRCNVVLEEIEKVALLNKAEQQLYEEIIGKSYFLRAYNHLILIGIWKGPFTAERKDKKGVAIRTTSDINYIDNKSTIGDAYDLIEEDLLKAIDLLPITSELKTMPNKIAAYALATRFFLLKGDYEKVIHFANEVFKHHNDIIDYKSVDVTATYPFKAFNEEVVFHVFGAFTLGNRAVNLGVSRELYELYDKHDYRKTAYYLVNTNGTIRYKGSYNGSATMFTGLTTSEVLLNKVEASLRAGKNTDAEVVLRGLLSKRYAEAFDLDTYLSQDNLLQIVRDERRKELAFRDIRWMDLQRYYYLDGYLKKQNRRVDGRDFEFSTKNLELPYPDNYTLFIEH